MYATGNGARCRASAYFGARLSDHKGTAITCGLGCRDYLDSLSCVSLNRRSGLLRALGGAVRNILVYPKRRLTGDVPRPFHYYLFFY